jgi:hypothetical protein
MDGIHTEGKLRSYPKIYNLGHRYIADLFTGPVVVQEKIDGSQISWGVDRLTGNLMVRSKNAIVDTAEPDSLFAPSVESINRMFDEGRLHMGWIYRGEAMKGAKHNSLEYERPPLGNLVLYDIDKGLEDRIEDQVELEHIAKTLGIECVQMLRKGEVGSEDDLEPLLSTPSQLGGAVEGVVFKNYDRFSTMDGKMLMGKLVSADFRELHKKTWKTKKGSNPVDAVIGAIATEARWQKAYQSLRDSGEIEHAPQDIGRIIKTVQLDVEDEAVDEIKDMLWNSSRKTILRGASRGLAEWYKAKLVEMQFDG